MTDRIYNFGTVSVANGDTQIVGTGTLWIDPDVRAYDEIWIGANPSIKILEVIDATHLRIQAWRWDDVVASADYSIVQDGLNRFTSIDVITDVENILASLNADGFYVFVKSAESEPPQRRGEEGQYARKPSTGEEWLKTGGVWVFQGINGNLNFDDTPWSGVTTYAQRAIIPFAGKLWLSLQGNNLNHRPDLSPTWWQLYLSGGDAYDVVTFDTDRPASGELVLKLVLSKAVTFFAGLVDSVAKAEVAATSSAVYSYKKNGTQFATLTFGAASATGVFASASDAVFAAGDVLTVFAPASRDATLSGVGATLSGYRT